MRPRRLLSQEIFNKTFGEHGNWLAIPLGSCHKKSLSLSKMISIPYSVLRTASAKVLLKSHLNWPWK